MKTTKTQTLQSWHIAFLSYYLIYPIVNILNYGDILTKLRNWHQYTIINETLAFILILLFFSH